MPGAFCWGCEDISTRADWIPMLVDSDGHQQIDLVGSDITLDVADTPPKYKIKTTDDGSGRIEYVGWALPGTAASAAGWAIAKLSYTAGSNPIMDWAEGVNTLTNVWDDKTGYDYS